MTAGWDSTSSTGRSPTWWPWRTRSACRAGPRSAAGCRSRSGRTRRRARGSSCPREDVAARLRDRRAQARPRRRRGSSVGVGDRRAEPSQSAMTSRAPTGRRRRRPGRGPSSRRRRPAPHPRGSAGTEGHELHGSHSGRSIEPMRTNRGVWSATRRSADRTARRIDCQEGRCRSIGSVLVARRGSRGRTAGGRRERTRRHPPPGLLDRPSRPARSRRVEAARPSARWSRRLPASRSRRPRARWTSSSATGVIVRHVGRGTFLTELEAEPGRRRPRAGRPRRAPPRSCRSGSCSSPRSPRWPPASPPRPTSTASSTACGAAAPPPTSRSFEAWDSALHRAIADAAHNGLLLRLFDIMNTARDLPVWGSLKRRTSASPERRARLPREPHRDRRRARRPRPGRRARRTCAATSSTSAQPARPALTRPALTRPARSGHPRRVPAENLVVSDAETVDAVVVGAGHNGLVAANMLADRGWSVRVLEASDGPGGAVRTEEITAPGFRSDLGSAFYPMGVVSPAFRALDLDGTRPGVAPRARPAGARPARRPGRAALARRRRHRGVARPLRSRRRRRLATARRRVAAAARPAARRVPRRRSRRCATPPGCCGCSAAPTRSASPAGCCCRRRGSARRSSRGRARGSSSPATPCTPTSG